MSTGGSKQTLARAVIDAARREGSGDNMTVIVVYFDTFQLVDPKTVATEAEGKEEAQSREKTEEPGPQASEAEGKEEAQSREKTEEPGPQATEAEGKEEAQSREKTEEPGPQASS